MATKILLGSEYDTDLRDRLGRTIDELGGHKLDKSWGVAGSQELFELRVDFPDGSVKIEAETYFGLSISGPAELVERIAARVSQG